MNDPFMIVSDLDGTLLGDDAALEEFAAWLAPQRSQFRLVYNSGRFPNSVRKSIAKTALPEPDAIIGGVGTQIQIFENRETFESWPNMNGHWNPNVLREVLAKERRLKLQPERFLSDCKISYFAEDATSEELTRWQITLRGAGIHARMVYSSHRDLDFLPEGCDKGTAAAHLAAEWGFTHDRVIACGDTANDCALFAQNFLGIVVGNALEELKMLDSSQIYHASGHFAAGVHEGILYWMERAPELFHGIETMPANIKNA